MGYTTIFSGRFTLDKPLTPAHARYLKQFNETRRMRRSEATASALPDQARETVGLPTGSYGAYFVGGVGYAGQGRHWSRRRLPVGFCLPATTLAGAGARSAANFKKLRAAQRDLSIIDYNEPPPDQPSLWCQWTPTADGKAIEWDGGEKFYDYVAWLRYWIDHFLTPWGYVLDGDVTWKGEAPGDTGTISVRASEIAVHRRRNRPTRR